LSGPITANTPWDLPDGSYNLSPQWSAVQLAAVTIDPVNSAALALLAQPSGSRLGQQRLKRAILSSCR
jgi:hypothetical protein